MQKCLAAVSRLDPAPDQVIVIDNSEGNCETRKATLAQGARYIAECDTDIVAFLDDDVIPAPHWLGLLIGPFGDERIGAVAGRIITPDSQNTDELEQGPRSLSNQDAHWIEIASFGGVGFGANILRRNGQSSTAEEARLQYPECAQEICPCAVIL